MRSVTGGLVVAWVLASTAIVSAQPANKQFICSPVDQTQASYPIECEVVDGVVTESSCSCKTDFVMVDLDTAPSALPPEPASAQ
jgi:hypothetical protein